MGSRKRAACAREGEGTYLATFSPVICFAFGPASDLSARLCLDRAAKCRPGYLEAVLGAGKGCGMPPNQLLGWSPPPLKGGLGFERDPRASGRLAASEGRGRSAASVGVSERIRMLRASTAPMAVECRRRCLRESEASGG